MKKIFLEIPTWLGDAVMTTPAIQNIILNNKDCEIIIFGSFVSTKIFLHHNNVKQIIIDDSKKEGNRYINLYKLAKSIKNIDLAFSFRKNFSTKFLMFFLNAKEKFIYKRYTKNQIHQVVRYNDFINKSLNINTKANKLQIFKKNIEKKSSKKLILGINPGATYGSAKRWYPQEFAKVAIHLANTYDIIIFGGPSEVDIAKDIENEIKSSKITNYKNLAGKTSIEELVNTISTLDLFITGDSGPMHVAAAFKVPTICIFGPTKHIETSQWMNKNSTILRKEFDCTPCMKRVCPLNGDENHQCMKSIKANDVIMQINKGQYNK